MIEFSQIAFPYYDREIKFAAPYIAQIGAFLHGLDTSNLNKVAEIDRRYGGIEYVVDVGACIGGLALLYALVIPGAEILALEPSSYNYKFLQFNIKTFANIKPLKIAAHNERDSLQLASPTIRQKARGDNFINTGLISVYGKSNHFREVVQADTLDNIVDKKVDWLKVDVEGHEQAVLEGATRILAEDRPVLQIETIEGNQNMGPYTTAGLMGLIGNARYVFITEMRADRIFLPAELLK